MSHTHRTIKIVMSELARGTYASRTLTWNRVASTTDPWICPYGTENMTLGSCESWCFRPFLLSPGYLQLGSHFHGSPFTQGTMGTWFEAQTTLWVGETELFAHLSPPWGLRPPGRKTQYVPMLVFFFPALWQNDHEWGNGLPKSRACLAVLWVSFHFYP